jgi:NAD+ kinase
MTQTSWLEKVERVLLLSSGSSSACDQAADRIRRDLLAAGLTVLTRREEFDPRRVDVVVLLGGDGFLMESARVLGFPPTPIFGVNFGSVGFLMNPRTSIDGLAARLRGSGLGMEHHPVLEGRARLPGEREVVEHAVNDLVMERTSGQTVRLVIRVNGVVLNEFSGDGVIVSTSAGSTAYNLAARGPVFHPRIEGMAITPLYPHRAAPFHSLQFTVIVPLDTLLEIEVLELEKRPVRLVADGRTLEGLLSVRVRDSGLRLRLLRVESHEFIATLARKFIGE